MVKKGQRAESRLRVRLPARLITHSGDYAAVLGDLSCNGARIERTNLPSKPGDAVLMWGKHEAFGRIRWCAPGRCGIHFYDPIPFDWVLAARQRHDAEGLPDDRELLRRMARDFVTGQRQI